MQKDIHRKIKRMIFSQIPQSELEIFSFKSGESIDGIKWIHSKEFSLNGKMYDIVKRDTIDGIVYFHCVWDKDEELLIKKYSNLVAGKIGDFNSDFTKIPIFNIECYINYLVKNSINYETSFINFFTYKLKILLGVNKNDYPPPELIF